MFKLQLNSNSKNCIKDFNIKAMFRNKIVKNLMSSLCKIICEGGTKRQKKCK